MRRWIKRITTATILIAAIGAGLASWAVRQTRQVPAFYTQAGQHHPEQAAQVSRQLKQDVEQLQDDAAKVGSWRAVFSDDEINAWLVEELPKKFPRLLARGASDPRVVIDDGIIRAAVRYKDKRFDTVVSCEIEVKLTEQPNMLALHVSQLKAGALPLPLSRFLKGISKEAATGDIDVRWDLTQEGPIALVTVPSEHDRYVSSPVIVESVELADAQLILAGHTGPLAHETYQPRGPVYRFVSYRHKDQRKRQPRQLSSSKQIELKLR